MKVYKFTCIDIDEETGHESNTTVEFTTDNDCWHGYDGPVAKFQDFLQGVGFVFDTDTQIGFMSDDGFESGSGY